MQFARALLLVAAVAVFVVAASDTAAQTVAARTFKSWQWGYNYDRAGIFGQDVTIGELLSAPNGAGLAKLEQDWGTMKSQLNGTSVRVLVNLDFILCGPTCVNQESLTLFDGAVKLAERIDIALLITGTTVMLPSTVPSWLANITDSDLWTAHGTFWTALAQRYAHNTNILAFDLANEPLTPWSDTQELVTGCFSLRNGVQMCYCHNLYRQPSVLWTQWVHATYHTAANLTAHWADFPRPGESWDAIAIPGQSNGTDPRWNIYAFRFQPAMKLQWCEGVAKVIRGIDTDRLITIGELFAQGAGACGGVVDFYSLHLYPLPAATTEKSLKAYYAASVGSLPADGKRLIVEEYEPMGLASGLSMSEGAAALIQATSSRGMGWYSFYQGNVTSLGYTGVKAAFYVAAYENWAAERMF